MSDNPFMALPSAEGAAPEQPDNPFMSLPAVGEEAPKEQSQGSFGSRMLQGAASMIDPVGANMATASQKDKDATEQTFQDKLAIFNRGSERYAIGGLQLASSGVRNTLGRLPGIGGSVTSATQGFDQKLSDINNQSEQEYQEAYARTPSPFTAMAGSIAGATTATAGTAGALMGSGPVGWGRLIAQGAAAGGSAGLQDVSDTTQERLIKGGTGALVGATTAAAVKGVSTVLEHIFTKVGISSAVDKLFHPKKAAVEDLAHAIKQDSMPAGAAKSPDMDKLASQAALRDVQAVQGKTLGRTPAEALGGESVRMAESRIPVSPEDQLNIAASYRTGQDMGKRGLTDAIDQMAPAGTREAKASAFEGMKSQFVSPDGQLSSRPSSVVPEVVQSNPILMEKYGILQNAQSKAFRDLPPNSVAQLHKVKSLIDKDLKAAKPNPQGITARPLDDDTILALKEAKDQLTPVLKQSPEYNTAMEASQKLTVQKHYKNLIADKISKAGQKGDLSEEDMFSAIFAKKSNTIGNQADVPAGKLRPKTEVEFLKDVERTGGDPEKAAELIRIADNLRGSPSLKLLKQGVDNSEVPKVAGRDIGVAQRIANATFLKRYYKAVLEVNLSGDKWADNVANVLAQPKGKAQEASYIEMIAKVMGKGTLSSATTEIGKTVAGSENFKGE